MCKIANWLGLTFLPTYNAGADKIYLYDGGKLFLPLSSEGVKKGEKTVLEGIETQGTLGFKICINDIYMMSACLPTWRRRRCRLFWG